jgi:ribosomal protein S18 acetylase RimI-like enzyme
MIASFVALGHHGKGIGERLLEATLTSAKEAGVTHIDASIRADNTGGLRYYSKMGFIDRHIYEQVPLSDGTCVDRVQKVLALKQN